MRPPFVFVVAAFLLWAFPVVAEDGPDTRSPARDAAPDFESWLAEQRDGRGRACDRRAVDALRDRWVVACGGSGLWMVRKNPSGALEIASFDDLGGPVVGLFRREGRVWAEVLRREARDVAGVDGDASHAAFPSDAKALATPVAPASPPTPAPPTSGKSARVTQVLPGEVVIDLGRDDRVEEGARVEFSVVESLEVGGEAAERRRTVAIGVVSAASDRFAKVELGIDERVPLGATARIVDDSPSAKRAAPPRLGGLWHAGFMLRPFIAIDDLGGGFVSDAAVGYRFESDVHVEACLSPLAFGTGDEKRAVWPLGAFVKGSFDSELFEMGLGFGYETIKNVPDGAQPGTGILFVQQLRLGSLDGLNVDFQSHAVLFHSRFDFSGLVGRAQIPVGRRFWLVFAGGGGSAGYAYGESGVRALLRGNGDRGSFFLTGTVGGAAIFQNREVICEQPGFTAPCQEVTEYAGPMIGGGGEWRF